MFLILLIIVLFCVLIWFQIKWRRVKNFWAVRGVPYIPSYPIVGNMTFLQRENPAIFMSKVYTDFPNSPYVGMWVFHRPALIINSPEIARRVLVKDFDNFKNRFLSSGKSVPSWKADSFHCQLISEDLLLAQASIFLVGGFDSSGAALTWATYELAHQPLLQDKLYAELQEARSKVKGKEFDPTTLAELPYLNAVIKETLRKYPPLGWLDRIAAKDYKIDDQLTIPTDTVIYVNAIGMQLDPDYFPNPEKFDPGRFLPENEKNITPTFMPFGDGPRGCIGKRFAFQTIRYGLSYVFLRYRAEPVANSPRPDDVEVETKGMFYMPDERLQLRFVQRQNL